MIFFHTKNPDKNKFRSALECKMPVYIFYGHLVFIRQFGDCCCQLVHFEIIWHIFPRFGIFYRQKSYFIPFGRIQHRNGKREGEAASLEDADLFLSRALFEKKKNRIEFLRRKKKSDRIGGMPRAGK
jgi:hypothetical protein